MVHYLWDFIICLGVNFRSKSFVFPLSLSLDEKNYTVEIFVLVCRLSILYIQMIERVYSTNELKSACECVNIEHRTCSVLRHIIQWNNSHAERKCRKTCRAEERMSIPVRCWNWMCAMRHTFTILPNMERTSFHSYVTELHGNGSEFFSEHSDIQLFPYIYAS